MEWKFSGERPVYQQIIISLRGAVIRGEYPPGGKVPSVRELAAQAQVNPNTVQRALTELEREGLLVGGGTMGRSVTQDEKILEATRKEALMELARDCAQRFQLLGVSAAQGAKLIMELEQEEKE